MEENNMLALNTEEGSKSYNKFLLTIYDFYVLTISARFFWKCPKSTILSLYNQCVSNQHLEIGVGTGYYLDKCRFPKLNPEITLMDLNSNCLEVTAARIKRYHPKTFKRDIYLPFNLPSNLKFDSVGVNYLLHCLPGTMDTKIQALANVKPYLNLNAVVFGTTILGKNVTYNSLVKRYLDFLNKKGIFTNLMDDTQSLEVALKKHFKDVAVTQQGNTAIFIARNG